MNCRSDRTGRLRSVKPDTVTVTIDRLSVVPTGEGDRLDGQGEYE